MQHQLLAFSRRSLTPPFLHATFCTNAYKSIAPEVEAHGYVAWCVPAPEDGTRLDRFIKRKAPGLPPGLIQRLIRQRRILVGEKPANRNAHPVHTGDVVRFPGHVKLGLSRGKKKPPPDDVSLAEAEVVRTWELFRDARCVVLNKPTGLPTQGGNADGRHLEALLPGLGTGRYFLVHRLDKDVSGAIVVARDVGAAGILSEAFRNGAVNKTYWGLIAGVPRTEKGMIDIPIDGRKALTKFRIIDAVEKVFSWVELEPKTGRKHQLRIHCAEGLGAALVGDEKYGSRASEVEEGGLECLSNPGLHLMSRKIEFPRMTQVGSGGGKRARRKPHDAQIISVTAPLPPHMKYTWKRFGFNERLA